MTYQKKGTFRADGPRNSQGFGWHWRFLRAILDMSEMHKKNRAECIELHDFFTAHPEAIPSQRELDSVPADKLISLALDLKKTFEREKANRDRVAKEHNHD